jgi:hypothetical protein
MVCRFQGVQPATDRVRHVPFWGILVSNINVFPFSGGATGDGSGGHVPFRGIYVFHKKVLSFSGGATEDFSPKWPKMAQNCRIIYAHVPFWAILILNLNVLPFGGHATLCVFS